MKPAMTKALAPLGALYSLVVKVRNALYRRGVLHTHDVSAPVISVGNLTSGGTGKTPLVEWIARDLSSGGRKVCVLTRGYGRQNPDRRVIAANGKTVLATVAEAGDEAFMLAEKLSGKAAVICDANRVAAARWARENLGTDVFVLDDAFQHQQIARELNILVIDATNPWGNGKILPAGVLREPITELKRADCVIITRADSQDSEALRARIKELRPDAPIFLSRMKHHQLREHGTDGAVIDSAVAKRIPTAAFCAIGNPDSFVSLLRQEGYEIIHAQAFRDHHNYTQADMDKLIRDAEEKGARALITTEKDAVKLRSLTCPMPCYVMEIAVEISDEGALRELIARAIV